MSEDNLHEVLTRQKEIIASLEQQILNFQTRDLFKENLYLKNELSKSQDSFRKEKELNAILSEENKKIKNTIYQQVYNEKFELLSNKKKKLDIYFKSKFEGGLNRLDMFELAAKRNIDEIAAKLEANKIETSNEIFLRLNGVQNLLKAKVEGIRQEYRANYNYINQIKEQEFEKLQEEKVTEEVIQQKIKKVNIESFIGLNIINVLGILLLIIGFIAAAQFTYFKLPDAQKSLFTFGIGAIMLAAGEILNRKNPNIFSLGITSGGISIIYVALGLSYFKFEIIGMELALILCILITLGAFVLSQRYNSQTVAIFTMIGGYLPIFSIAGDISMVYGVMVYFLILNILTLINSTRKRWIILAYISFILNVIGSGYITSIVLDDRVDNHFSRGDLATIFYLLFVFIVYTLIPVLGTYKKNESFKNTDIVLLAINTVVSNILIYTVFYLVDLSDYTGLIAIIFALVYIAMGRFVDKFMPKEFKVKLLFYITGLTFLGLSIPFQFGHKWISMGWLVEGVALLIYGIFKNSKSLRIAGVVVSTLCLGAFIQFDLRYFKESIFTLKYLLLTLGSILVLLALINKYRASKKTLYYKCCTTINAWIFLIYIIGKEFRRLLEYLLPDTNLDLNYTVIVSIALVSIFIAYIIPQIKMFTEKIFKYVSLFVYGITLMTLYVFTFVSPVIGDFSEVTLGIFLTGTIEMALVLLLSLFALKELLAFFIDEKSLAKQWYSLFLSLYFIITLTQILTIQYEFDLTNAVFSCAYLITALAWIISGFVNRYALLRRFGLGLCLLAVAKLFIIDLSYLSEGYRIISYFIFGITLLAISFVYQYFIKRINYVPEDKVVDDNKLSK